mmetsp:Transcript_67103/g.112334  ORF Transcript_67103/g.112334 Transcript_67103/m.112334 type:complete len:220 (-) Transcript_67103:1151-1810(-)
MAVELECRHCGAHRAEQRCAPELLNLETLIGTARLICKRMDAWATPVADWIKPCPRVVLAQCRGNLAYTNTKNDLHAKYAAMPAKYPAMAKKLIRLVYQPKSAFSIPMNATPAADPIIRMLPPVPAQYATSCQKMLFTGIRSRLYIPIVAATNGTLSITADARPMAAARADRMGRYVPSHSASLTRIPDDWRAATDIRMPRKNRMPWWSILDSADGAFR